MKNVLFFVLYFFTTVCFSQDSLNEIEAEEEYYRDYEILDDRIHQIRMKEVENNNEINSFRDRVLNRTSESREN